MQELGSNRELQELSANYTSTTETSGQYSVSVSENLTSGTYQIIIEDDAGNASAPHPDYSFKIDSDPPSISSIQLIDNTDKGISSNDLSTAVIRPVVIFEGESDLNLTIKHDNGSTVSVMPSSSYTVSGGNDENLRLFEIFSENTSVKKQFQLLLLIFFEIKIYSRTRYEKYCL